MQTVSWGMMRMRSSTWTKAMTHVSPRGLMLTSLTILKKSMSNIFLFGIGMQEVLVIALIVLLLFGGKKIPELMNGLGKGVKSFKDGMKEIADEDKDRKTDE